MRWRQQESGIETGGRYRLNNIWQQRTPRSIWIRALIYLLIVSTGWLFVLPVTLVFLEQRSLKVQFRKMPYPFLGAAVFLFGTILSPVPSRNATR